MADRPIECSQCKKGIKIVYKEIVDHSMLCTEMCHDCPILQQKLHGHLSSHCLKDEKESGLCCGNCRTSLTAIKMGNPLGCSECYSVFADLLISELISNDRLPSRIKKDLLMKKNQPLHLGKVPHVSLTIPPAGRLNALNEALNDALKKENYEQAAWIRDQIKDLTQKGA